MGSQYASPSLMRAAKAAPYLERGQEHGLAVRWKDLHDQQALHQLASSHMRLVISMAAKFRNYGLSMSDLIQEGHIGLLEAAARFDPDREVRFSTYATWWIRASIQDYILKNWSIVRGGTSSAQKALFFNLRRLRARLSQGQQNLTTAALYGQVAQAIGVSVKDVETMDHRLSGPDTSLNAPMASDDEGSSGRMDFLVDGSPLPDQIVEEHIDSGRRVAWLRQAMTVLNPREKLIVQKRRLEEDTSTLEELGQTLGISKERVRQIETRAMEKLKDSLVRSNPSMAGMPPA
ncbi:MAG: RNA polymerase factor sigma-32 [Rhizobiaceae bacterium]